MNVFPPLAAMESACVATACAPYACQLAFSPSFPVQGNPIASKGVSGCMAAASSLAMGIDSALQLHDLAGVF